MAMLHAVILGVIQGIAEFLPISSSGHLVIAGAVLAKYSSNDMPAESAMMNVALHCGTLVAIVIVYRRELWELRRDPRTIGLIILATVPVGVVGLMFKDQIESLFTKPIYAGGALLITALMLFASRQMQRAQADTRRIGLMSALVIGMFQAVAIVPGVSRSGSTIAAALMCGTSRADAAKFSFLIAIPAIGGATLVKCRDFLTDGSIDVHRLTPIAIGTVISLVVGILSLRLLIRLVVADRLHWFAIYCAAAGLATIIWQLAA